MTLRTRETDERMRRTDEGIDKMAVESAARGRVLDQRIADLVSTMGEFIRQNRN